MIGSETGSRVPSPMNKFELFISSLKVRNSLRLQLSSSNRNFNKIRYKINKSIKLNEICSRSRAKCCEATDNICFECAPASEYAFRSFLVANEVIFVLRQKRCCQSEPKGSSLEVFCEIGSFLCLIITSI